MGKTEQTNATSNQHKAQAEGKKKEGASERGLQFERKGQIVFPDRAGGGGCASMAGGRERKGAVGSGGGLSQLFRPSLKWWKSCRTFPVVVRRGRRETARQREGRVQKKKKKKKKNPSNGGLDSLGAKGEKRG